MSIAPSATTASLKIPIATFSNKADNRPRSLVVAWPELVKMLSDHLERPTKDGPLWSPTKYGPDATRGNNFVLEVTAAVGDFDDGASWEEVAERLAPYEYVAHSTYSFEPEHPKFRVVIPLTRPVPGHLWPAAKAKIDYHVFCLASDPAAKDASRIYYRPSCPPGALRFNQHHQGEALDVDALPDVPQSHVTRNSPDVGDIPTHPQLSLSKRALEFVANGAPIGQQRKMAVVAARSYLSVGYSVEDAAAAIWRGLQASPQQDGREPWTQADAMAIAVSVAKSPPTPLEPPRNPSAATRPREAEKPQPLGAHLSEKAAEAIRHMPPPVGDKALLAEIDKLREKVTHELLRTDVKPDKRPPATLRRREAGKILLSWLKEKGGFLQSETEELLYFFEPERRLFRLESDRWGAFLYRLSGANPAGTDYAYLAADCKTEAIGAQRRKVVRVASWDSAEMILRVSRFDGTVFRLDGEAVTEEPNGKLVLFEDDPLWEPFVPEWEAPGALRWLTTELPNWDNGEIDTQADPEAAAKLRRRREMYGLAFRALVLSTFFTELCPTRPLTVFTGEKGSGKSMNLRMLLKLTFGAIGELSGVPDKPDGFTAAAAISHILAYDNLDEFCPWLRDKLARLSTGAVDDYRRLYTSNELGRVRYRCWLAFTSRTPDTLRRDDLADRMLILPVQRLAPGSVQAERSFQSEAEGKRNRWWGDVLTTLNKVVAGIRAGSLRSTSDLRLADWESLGRLIARVEDAEGLWDAFVPELRRNQADFLLTDEPIVEALDVWLSDPANEGRELSTSTLEGELRQALFKEEKVKGDWPKTTRAFGKKLAQIRRDLGSRHSVSWRTGVNRVVFYQFAKDPNPLGPLGAAAREVWTAGPNERDERDEAVSTSFPKRDGGTDDLFREKPAKGDSLSSLSFQEPPNNGRDGHAGVSRDTVTGVDDLVYEDEIEEIPF